MATLMPRWLGGVGDWFETDLPMFGTHPIRVEDYRDEEKYVLRAELPGMDPEKDISITVANGMLTVEAERSEEARAKGRSEFRYGSMRRTVTLPADVDADKITARYEKGILEVTVPLPKAPHPEAKTITIEKA